MDNHLLKLLAMNCLMDFCLSASIASAPSTFPACFPGSSDANDCMTYTCDENGEWQEYEFNITDDCCMKSYHPSCAERGIKNSESLVSTDSSLTTTPTPICKPGTTKEQDCRIFSCQDGQWQVGEFTATKECCLQTYHPKCQIMGFYTTTESLVSTDSSLTTTPTPICNPGATKEQDCRIFSCQDGQWLVGEFKATMECCLQTYHPKCQFMGFYTTTGQFDTNITTKETINTTVITTTPTPKCALGSDRVIDCTIFLCWNGDWEPFEFTATEECCLKELHPRCILFGFTGEEEGLASPVSSASTALPKVECIHSTSRVQDCGIYLCEDGQWLFFEFIASEECCANKFHPKCAALNTAPQDDSTREDWPLTDSDSSEEIDVLLIHLPLIPVVLFPVNSNDGAMNSQKENSDAPNNSYRDAHHQE